MGNIVHSRSSVYILLVFDENTKRLSLSAMTLELISSHESFWTHQQPLDVTARQGFPHKIQWREWP